MKSAKIFLRMSMCLGILLFSCKKEEIPLGRWDITIYKGKKTFPSWLELEQGERGLKGRFVGRTGSVRPVTTLDYHDQKLFFSLPVQWEKHSGDMEFSATYRENRIEGITYDESGNSLRFEAVPAPPLNCRENNSWGPELDLLTEVWKVRNPDTTNGWTLRDGVLENTPPSSDLISQNKFTDFILSAEVYLPDSSNSGIYLRGRYEVQLTNKFPQKTGDRGKMGAIYGFIAPDTLFDRPGGVWYKLEITLIGRCVTLKLNDILLIDHQEIPGITGGALDSREGEAGPIMLQGDHGPVKFRHLRLRPAESSEIVRP